MEINLKQLEESIKRGEKIVETGQEIESILNQKRGEEHKSQYLYLLGLILAKQNRADQATEVLEQAIESDTNAAPAYFLLSQLQLHRQYQSRALECLHNCIRLNYKPSYSKKMLIKINYNSKDFIAAINYLQKYQQELRPKLFWKAMLIECLAHLNLYQEAGFRYAEIIKERRLHGPISQRLEALLAEPEKTKYASLYQANQAFFRAKGMEFCDFEDIPYKVVNYLERELVYNCQRGYVTVELTQIEESQLDFGEDDTLIINNTDNVKVFERLVKVFNEVDASLYRKRIAAIPVYVVENDLYNWQLMMQLFDFNTLAEWKSLHFWVGLSQEELVQKLSDESATLPNVLYGTDLEQFYNLLEEIKKAKDELFLNRLQRVKSYYQNCNQGTFQKILVITTIYNDTLLSYGKQIYDYLKTKGYDCLLYHETPPCLKFTQYSDLKILDQFQPDLVINLFAAKEDLVAFSDLALPFANWFLFNKSLSGDSKPRSREFLAITGNILGGELLAQKGYQSSQIARVPLPVLVADGLSGEKVQCPNEIGIVSELYDLDLIINNLAELLLTHIKAHKSMGKDDLQTILREIYFEIYTGQISKSFARPELEVYDRIIGEAFARRNQVFDYDSLRLLSVVIKRELENTLLKLLQVKWIISELKNTQIEIYGEGWEKDPSLKSYVKGKIDLFEDMKGYQSLVLRNKINLHIGNRLQNNSLMQPDLINGIAAGGFFLVNDLLVKEYGDDILKPFGGLLITYGSREDLVEKVNYYLKNENERQAHAQKLQAYLRQNFTMEKVVETILLGMKESLKENLN